MKLSEKTGLLAFYFEKRIRSGMGKTKGLNKIAGREILPITGGNRYLKEAVEKGAPFMAARYGSTEMQVVNRYLLKRAGIVREYKDANRAVICTNAGFFPEGDDILLDRFAEEMLTASGEVDLLGLLGSYDEGWIIRKHIPVHTKITYLRGLEPYYHERPWSEALRGKRVLVVHPFKNTILKQYEKREYLFENKEVLPEFDLKVVKAVQSIAGEKTEFKTWFDALDFMTNEALSQEFDVALIGCGAYGFPLASRIKKAGKQALHMGGALQILFGIKGGRWDSHPILSKLYNEYWVRPSEDEMPGQYKKVENGCYW